MSPSLEAAARIVADLVAAGVRDAVLSPGSRSAPLAYALTTAERDGRIRLHVRHDERSAAFVGLGIGRADPAHPAVVVTTSGSAVAHLLPAAMEAHHAGVPLLLLTADRPVRLRGTWANQTSDAQHALFAPIAHTLDVDPATAEGTPWLDALAAARGDDGRRPGPAHLNVCFDVPLQPEPGAVVDFPEPTVEEVRAPRAPVGSVELVLGPRTVVVAGDHAGAGAADLAVAAGWPLLAEPTSGARHGGIPAYRLLLPDLASRIERVVVFGRPTLSRPVTSLLEDPRVEVVQVVAHPDDLGPGRPAARVGGVTVPHVDDPAWRALWWDAGESRMERVLAAVADWPLPTGLQVARSLAAATRADQALFVGSSNAVRDLDLVAGDLPRETLVVANRGLAGIDGAASTALGVAIACGRATRAYLGDLTFLHDLNGLAVPAVERDRVRLQVVVANDDGGGIFATLEHARHPEAFERVFGTPTGANLAELCAGYGIRHQLVDVARLDDALAEIPPGISVVEVPTSRERLGDLHARL